MKAREKELRQRLPMWQTACRQIWQSEVCRALAHESYRGNARKLGRNPWCCHPTQLQALFAFWGHIDRKGRVRSGAAWLAAQKHRPLDTPVRAARPVNEGPDKTRVQVVRQHRVDKIAASRGCWEGEGILTGHGPKAIAFTLGEPMSEKQSEGQMNKVVKLPGLPEQADLGVEEVDDTELRKAAMEAWNDMVQGQCSLEDCILAVFMAGVNKVTGAPSKRRKKPAVPPCPYEDIVNLYERHLDMLPKVAEINTARKKLMREVWTWVLRSKRRDGTRRAATGEEALAWINLYFETATHNDFICGRTPKVGAHAGWVADFDYVLSKSGMQNVIEKTQAK